jgi:quercetin dioxygenase-like cupin family protein
MNKRALWWMGAGAAIAVATMTVLPQVGAQMTPPTENKGVTIKPVAAIPLAAEITEIGGRQLRLRYITLAPGGVFAEHNHKDRPTVEYVLKGKVVEYRGSVGKPYQDGDAVLSDKDTTHWWRNEGTEEAIFITADVFNPPK